MGMMSEDEKNKQWWGFDPADPIMFDGPGSLQHLGAQIEEKLGPELTRSLYDFLDRFRAPRPTNRKPARKRQS